MAIPKTQVLITVAGAERGRFLCEPGEYILGRNQDCHIPVEAELVSRRHAKLTIKFDHAFIEDLGSSNGTQVNGQPVAGNTRLWPNQKIQVGAATIELRRLKVESTPDMVVTPTGEVMRRVLPEAFLREKKYDIGGVIAQGGMGAILNAKEATTERTVAMKVMLNTNSPDALLRFLNEAKITAQLEHPNIVPVHELSVDENDQVFYTMKMVKGITLKKVLKLIAEGVGATVKKYPLAALLTIFQKVCDALAFAHSKGVIHRDLKPENIMIGDYGEVLLMDWGLAKLTRSAEPGGTRNAAAGAAPELSAVRVPGSDLGMTLAGTVMGTPHFMSPEQARGEVETLDARSDIYALGAVLYQILSLRLPVTGKGMWNIVGKVGRGEIEPLENVTPSRKGAKTDKGSDAKPSPSAPSRLGVTHHLPNGRIPDSLAAVVRKAMALDREARYRSVPDLQKDIEAFQTGFATSAENAGLVKQIRLLVKRHKATALGIAAVLIVVAVFGTKVILEGRRAEREAVRANAALADLKKSAPDLLALAASEAGLQRYESALKKADATLALDPDLAAAYWRRGWVLLAQEKLPEALAALHVAADKDPANRRFAALLPLVAKMAAAPVTKRHDIEFIKPLYDHLTAVGAVGEATPLLPHLKLGNEARVKLVRERIERFLGKGVGFVALEKGELSVSFTNLRIGSLEPVRGLPIDALTLNSCGLTSLEPLRGMRLLRLTASGNPIEDLSPLEGMPLEFLSINDSIKDFSPMRGMALKSFNGSENRQLTDLRPLAGMRLESMSVAACPISDFSVLRGMPLRRLEASRTRFSDARVLAGMPLTDLSLSATALSDLNPLVGLPLSNLIVSDTAVRDFTPLLRIPTLESLAASQPIDKLLPLRAHPGLKQIKHGSAPYRPVAEFWAEYDAKQNAAPK